MEMIILDAISSRWFLNGRRQPVKCSIKLDDDNVNIVFDVLTKIEFRRSESGKFYYSPFQSKVSRVVPLDEYNKFLNYIEFYNKNVSALEVNDHQKCYHEITESMFNSYVLPKAYDEWIRYRHSNRYKAQDVFRDILIPK